MACYVLAVLAVLTSTNLMSVLPPELADDRNRNSLSNRFASSGNMSDGLNEAGNNNEIGLTFYQDGATRTKKSATGKSCCFWSTLFGRGVCAWPVKFVQFVVT